MNNFIDQLIDRVKNSEDTADVCRVLVDASFGESDSLSESQFKILSNIFTDSEITAAIIVFLHQFEEFNYDFEKVKIFYNIVHEKFHQDNFVFNSKKNITA